VLSNVGHGSAKVDIGDQISTGRHRKEVAWQISDGWPWRPLQGLRTYGHGGTMVKSRKSGIFSQKRKHKIWVTVTLVAFPCLPKFGKKQPYTWLK
jgi:hypothetical protein